MSHLRSHIDTFDPRLSLVFVVVSSPEPYMEAVDIPVCRAEYVSLSASIDPTRLFREGASGGSAEFPLSPSLRLRKLPDGA